MKTKFEFLVREESRHVYPSVKSDIPYRVVTEVRVLDLPEGLPYDVDPRDPDKKSKVSKGMVASLWNNPEMFLLKNAGIYTLAGREDYDSVTNLASITMEEVVNGILNGGHTYAVLCAEKEKIQQALAQTNDPELKALARRVANARVSFSVYVGKLDPKETAELAQALNTSRVVPEYGFAAIRGDFDWLQELLAKTNFGSAIAYRPNSGPPVPADLVTQLLTLFHPDYENGEDTAPFESYLNKNKCVQRFSKDIEGYQRLSPIIPDILKLSDYIRLYFPGLYNANGTGRLGSILRERYKQEVQLHFLGSSVNPDIPNSFYMPILSAFRCAVNYRNMSWQTDPYKLFDRVGPKLVGAIRTRVQAAKDKKFENFANNVGKTPDFWINVYNMANRFVEK